ncbi:hypothetical protein, partial [Staphylococcus saprophyticus]|uniref:hypothetical protein n=1 Tax=Staphylococcus saprophyticus TaxID=29385 RepID=UPI00386F234A
MTTKNNFNNPITPHPPNLIILLQINPNTPIRPSLTIFFIIQKTPNNPQQLLNTFNNESPLLPISPTSTHLTHIQRETQHPKHTPQLPLHLFPSPIHKYIPSYATPIHPLHLILFTPPLPQN